MIIDKFDNHHLYPYGPAWKKAFDFLASLSADSEEKEYPIMDNRVFARVMGYRTKTPEQSILESHRRFVDIQAVLIGAEGMEWFPESTLSVEIPYDEEKDAAFYVRPHQGPVRVQVYPQTFVALFPDDAHMPALEINHQSEWIKKVVIKIQLDLLDK